MGREEEKSRPGDVERQIALALCRKKISFHRKTIPYNSPWKVLGKEFRDKKELREALYNLDHVYGVLKLVPKGNASFYEIIEEGLNKFEKDYYFTGDGEWIICE